jgi:F-type H+-transporting ATPase subunit gamma
VANLRDIKKRIGSVTSTQQITRTMEMVATAKIRRATDRIVAATPYALAMAEVLRSVARRTKRPKNPLLVTYDKLDRIVVIVVASDRGMAGGFNSTVLRTAEDFCWAASAHGIYCEIIACGRKAETYFKYRNMPMSMVLGNVSADPTIVDASRIASYCIDRYTKRSIQQVVMFYNHAKNVADQVLKMEQILPITQLQFADEYALNDQGEWEQGVGDESAKTASHDASEKLNAAQVQASFGAHDEDAGIYGYEYDPSPAAVLNVLLPDYVKTRIYHGLLDSAAGEQGARRKAMKSATDNANEMIQTLLRMYNRARQSAITTEITEIVGGAAALEES